MFTLGLAASRWETAKPAMRATRPGNARPAASAIASLPLIALHPNFFDAVGEAAIVEATKPVPAAGLRGLVVPHHLLAATVMARGYAAVPGDVTTVFIIGPNHRNEGGAQLTTASARWETPAGEVTADAEMVASLAAGVGAAINVTAYRDEHSVGAQTYFIRHYLPQAKIVPLTLDSYTTVRQAEAVGEWLAEHAPPHSLVVFSIDFSHYLPEAETRRHDVETRHAIESRDLAAISRYGNDNVDSPMTLIAALTYARTAGLKVNITENTNSNDFLMKKEPTTTSHFLIELIK